MPDKSFSVVLGSQPYYPRNNLIPRILNILNDGANQFVLIFRSFATQRQIAPQITANARVGFIQKSLLHAASTTGNWRRICFCRKKFSKYNSFPSLGLLPTLPLLRLPFTSSLDVDRFDYQPTAIVIAIEIAIPYILLLLSRVFGRHHGGAVAPISLNVSIPEEDFPIHFEGAFHKHPPCISSGWHDVQFTGTRPPLPSHGKGFGGADCPYRGYGS